MIKRFWMSVIAVLCCVCAVFTLASCGGDKDADNGEDNTSSIFYFEYKKTKIELGKKADDVFAALGDAKSVKELGDCAGLGAQVKYTYDNFDIYTLKNDEGETIDEIAFGNDLVETPKGISIGMKAKDVTDAYGEPSSQDDNNIIYINGRNALKFGLDNGKVDSIYYVRAAK